MLQIKTLDIVKGNEHIQTIVEMIRDHRKNAENVTAKILKKAGNKVKPLNVDITVARIAGQQKPRNKPPAENPGDFWKRSLIILYLDLIIGSLQVRFSTDKSPAFALTHFYLDNMKHVSLEE
ncbi:unnamed protein product [Psylliodes chrysocephalus]|uniref:Uncharacterized protein n=1 Tax=Psylliodes chrysocephalus TaxID=3402493 RepID=A0A9P0GG93_9CUCU|nr:unnamed protein product [Psylliodes chrysocephala]